MGGFKDIDIELKALREVHQQTKSDLLAANEHVAVQCREILELKKVVKLLHERLQQVSSDGAEDANIEWP